MGVCKMVSPEVVRLTLPDGDWLDVKRQLTYGEQTRMKASLISEVRADGRVTPDLTMVDLAQVAAYLVDWSFVDPKGKQIDISTDARKRAALEALRADAVAAIVDAVNAHVEAMDAERGQEKNAQAAERV